MAYQRVNRAGAFSQTIDQAQFDEGLRQHMLRVYNYLATGLAVSALVAWAIMNTPLGLAFGTPVMTPGGSQILIPNTLGYIGMFAPLGMLLIAMFAMRNMSLRSAQIFFWSFVAIKGIGLALIVQMYTGVSVVRTLFITTAAFAGLSLYGYTTKRSLSGLGSFLIMGLIGIIIAGIVNIFLASPMLHFVISAAGVLIFSGLIAYDTQNIKEEYAEHYGDPANHTMAVMGALSLYINFINLFILLLQFFGSQRE